MRFENCLKWAFLGAILLSVLITANYLPVENEIYDNTTQIHNLDLKQDAINNLTLAEKTIFNATEKLKYLESINGEISDLIQILDLAIQLFNNATNLFQQEQYNESIYYSAMAKQNATQVIIYANSRIPETISKNQQIYVITIILIAVLISIICIAAFLIFKFVKKSKQNKFLNMEVSLPKNKKEGK
ncbi:MAG: FeoB-associated Cys-rich membrane protein [Candidatus Helarchaeota archaeon]